MCALKFIHISLMNDFNWFNKIMCVSITERVGFRILNAKMTQEQIRSDSMRFKSESLREIREQVQPIH